MWTLLFLGVVVIAIAIWAGQAQSKSNIVAAERDLAAIPGYSPALIHSTGYNKPSISIDPNSHRFAITLPNQQPKVYRFDQLIAAEIEKNGSSIIKTNRGSQAVGATAGALLLGPAGLLLGGLSGSKRSEEMVKRVSIKIYTNDLMAPITSVHFLDSWTGFKADSSTVRSAA